MALRLGADAVTRLMLGTDPVTRLFLGTELVWSRAIEVAAVSSATGAATTVDVPFPTGAGTGDTLVMFVAQRGSTSTSVTVPGGWSQVGTWVFGASRMFAFTRVVAAGEPASYGVQLNSTSEHSIAIVAVRNAAGVDVSTGGSNTTASSSIPSPSVTTTVPGALVLRCVWVVQLSTSTPHNITWPSPQIEVVEPTSSGGVMSVAVAVQDAAGASGTVNATASGSGPRAWVTLALRPI